MAILLETFEVEEIIGSDYKWDQLEYRVTSHGHELEISLEIEARPNGDLSYSLQAINSEGLVITTRARAHAHTHTLTHTRAPQSLTSPNVIAQHHKDGYRECATCQLRVVGGEEAGLQSAVVSP